MPEIENIRKMKITTGKGKDVRDTKMLSGEAEKTPAESASNDTVQYTTSGDCKGPWGGEAKQN